MIKKGNVWALLPIIIFLILFVGGGLIVKDMYAIPTLLCFLIALVFALFQNKKVKMSDKMQTLTRGIGNKNIITMVLIFLSAGIFTGAVKSIGGVKSTVNFGLSILPPEGAVVGLFIIACFISMAMGTSVGTITALAPIGYGIAQATSFPVAMCLAAVVSGAMFGDNLSMVSDTTIAAVNTQGCNMKDKFKTNFFIVLPAAIISMIVFLVLALGQEVHLEEDMSYNFVKILPYIFVLVTAIIGINVFIVLAGGTILSLIIGLCLGDPEITFVSMMKGIGGGLSSMFEISLISIVVAGIVEIIQANGGIDAIIYGIKKCVKGKRGAQAGIAVLVTLIDFFTANNTVAIVIAGPIAKDIAEEYDISPKRSAAILDIFASFAQGIIPYGAQLLAAGTILGENETVIAKISPLSIMPYLIYPYVMMLCALIFIAFVKEKKDWKSTKAKMSLAGENQEIDGNIVLDSTTLETESVEVNSDVDVDIDVQETINDNSAETSTKERENSDEMQDDDVKVEINDTIDVVNDIDDNTDEIESSEVSTPDEVNVKEGELIEDDTTTISDKSEVK